MKQKRKYRPILSWRQKVGPKIIYPLSMIHNLFFWKTNNRPIGISCMIRLKDEEDWIALSMKSAVPLADELVVVDGGSKDKSFEIVNKIKNELAIPVKVFQTPELKFCEQSNFVLNQTSYCWIMRWDADFVGHSDISELRSKVLSLPNGYYLIYPSIINLDGDLEHTFASEVHTVGGYLHYHNDKIRFKMKRRFENLGIPLNYKRLFIFKPYIFHMRSVKPARRLLFRAYWTRWMEVADYKKYPKLENFVQEKIKEEYGTDSVDEAVKLHMEKSICSQLIHYRPDYYRDYPDILKNALKSPKYKIIYRGGIPVGRNDVMD